MGTAFSQDLRERVIKAMESGKYGRHEVAEKLEVSVWYVDVVMKRLRETGSREAKAWNGGRERVLRLHQEWIRKCVEERPDITLEELCIGIKKDKQVKANRSMMGRELIEMRLPLKKSRFTTASARPSG